jgi:acyl carrier protein phosphodiesterase
MNLLAHAHLSFNQPPILVGNMISDFVKGKKQFDYPKAIQKGIQLHRAIDNFTDTHEITQEVKAFFKPRYRLYSGAFADVAYDHFLANDTTYFSTGDDLQKFAATTYERLQLHVNWLPETFKKMLPYMTEHNWLYNYKNKWGIEKSFAGLAKRALYITESDSAFELFNTHYGAIKSFYQAFYPDLKNYAEQQLEQLLNA